MAKKKKTKSSTPDVARKFTPPTAEQIEELRQAAANGIHIANARLSAIHLPTGDLEKYAEAGEIAGVENIKNLKLWELVNASELLAKRERWKAKLVADITRGDGEHDNTQNGKNNLPQSSDVLELCRHLKTKLTKFATMIECARDFCRRNGRDETTAENLLRQAKRFPSLWRT